jgi:hypothetical protein
MNQLKSRVDRLYRKTHGFIPPADLRFLIKFYEDLYERSPKSPDLEERLARFRVVYHETEESKPDELTEAIRFGKTSKAFGARVGIDVMTANLENFPRGRWVTKDDHEKHLAVMKTAVAHFKNRHS